MRQCTSLEACIRGWRKNQVIPRMKFQLKASKISQSVQITPSTGLIGGVEILNISL